MLHCAEAVAQTICVGTAPSRKRDFGSEMAIDLRNDRIPRIGSHRAPAERLCATATARCSTLSLVRTLGPRETTDGPDGTRCLMGGARNAIGHLMHDTTLLWQALGVASAQYTAFLADLPSDERATLAKVNSAGLRRLHDALESRDAVAFLGAGASAPLYPSWDSLIVELIDTASDRLTEAEAGTLRGLASATPDAVMDVVRRKLDATTYWQMLREAFRVRRDETGRTWTATHELIVRCDFGAVVTTNYDPGIVDARARVRAHATSTSFSSWTDDVALDRWRNGDVFRSDELPVLFAHGHHNQPEAIALATTEYRRAYESKLTRVLESLITRGPLVWVGFSFADQRIAAVLREIADGYGTRANPGMATRHVALMPWDPHRSGGAPDPGILREICGIQYGSDVVLYPAPRGDHSALRVLLAEFTHPRFAPVSPKLQRSVPRVRAAAAADHPTPATRSSAARWMHRSDPDEHFTGRDDELAKLDCWGADPVVRLIGVTAWGGAGKTALVSHGFLERTPTGFRGLFAWNFNEDPSERRWAHQLLIWAQESFGIGVRPGSLRDRVLAVVQQAEPVLVLDGLEVLQDGTIHGRLLDGLLRDLLTTFCRIEHGGLAVLTSRFVFGDLERFDGGAARMLDLPGLSDGDGAEVLARAGAGWLTERERRELVRGVAGHALAVTVIGGALAQRPAIDGLQTLLADLKQTVPTHKRIMRVLTFYAGYLE